MSNLSFSCGVLAVSLAITACGRPAAGEPSTAPVRGEAAAVMVDRGPAADGTLDDPLWQKCPPWPLGDCTSDRPQKCRTWAKVLFDPTHVTIGVWCEEPDADGPRMTHAKRDAPVYEDDSVEVFLRPDPRQPYCQFVVNPRGALYDARNKDSSWNSSAEAKAAVQKGKSWTATLRIPLAELPVFAGDDQAWTMNIYRTRPARGGDPVLMYSWSIMSEDDYHATSQFGVVTGIDIPQRPEGVTRVRDPGAPQPLPRNRGEQRGGVIVYRRATFDQGDDGWQVDRDAQATLSRDAADGQALRVECPKGWTGCELPMSIVGSRDLKIALAMKGHGLESAGINVSDAVAGDNTTAYGYRYLTDGQWSGIVYRLDQFRYNSQTTGFVSPNTHYTRVRFYGPAEAGPDRWFTIDNFVIYRGTDGQPPEKVSGLEARPDGRGIELTWAAAEDNVAAQLYVIARADQRGPFRKIAESRTTGWTDTTAGTGAYRYRVFAVDFEENLGPWSEPVAVRGTAPPVEAKLTPEQQDRLRYADHVRRVHDRGAGKVRKNHVTLFGDSLTGATVYPQCARAAFGNLAVDAFGYPAMRTSFARGKVTEILKQQNPEYLLILYGTNNNKADEQIPTAMDDLAAVVAACEANGTVAVLGTIPPRGWTPDSAPEANFNRHLVELCRKLQIPTAYIFEGFQAAGPENRKTYLGGDGVHWTGEGMAIAGRAWGRTLDQVRFVVRD